MKICLVGHDILPVLLREYNHHGVGGAQLQMTLIAKALVSRGYEVSLVVGDYGQKDGAIYKGIKLYKTFGLNEGLPVIRFVYPRWVKTWMALARANADVYFTSCAGMHVGLLALFCKSKGKGFVYRLAHDTDADPNNLLIRYARDKKLYEYGLRRAAAVLCQNSLQQKLLTRNYSIVATPIKSLVENPEIVYPLKDRSIEILWVSNIRAIKRPDQALELARRLTGYRMHIIGGSLPGSEKLYATIAREASALPNVTFHGRVPYHDIGDFYDRARVFVNTSDTEGFPNSYLQAWRRGVPVVAFFDPDGLIRREGLGYAADSLEDMARAVEKLLTDDTEWHTVSQRCRAYMEKHHGDDVVLKPYLGAIEKAYAARRRP